MLCCLLIVRHQVPVTRLDTLSHSRKVLTVYVTVYFTPHINQGLKDYLVIQVKNSLILDAITENEEGSVSLRSCNVLKGTISLKGASSRVWSSGLQTYKMSEHCVSC